LPSGEVLKLSPGEHNVLQAAIITEFAPRFAPGSLLLYLGDTAQKHLHVDQRVLDLLKIPVTKHDKLPDVVLHLPTKNWLFLIEAVTSHGPVSPKRKRELEAVLESCPIPRVYVSAFLGVREFKRHAENIAWETEVWIAEMPDHLIHFNGDKFLGPIERHKVCPEKPSLRWMALSLGVSGHAELSCAPIAAPRRRQEITSRPAAFSFDRTRQIWSRFHPASSATRRRHLTTPSFETS